ncbi:MAG: protein kinase [Vicinamibacterales bacterium]
MEEIGVGGYGHVYRARDAKLDRDVAVKGMRASGDVAPLHAERLAAEARLLASLAHPSLCVVYDLVDAEGGPYLVMELLAGETLAHRLQRASLRPLPRAEALGIAAAIADGLAYVHERGVVHQDVTPGNVMLTPTGVKLLDFGIARLRSVAQGPERTETAPVQSSRAAGTLRYMAPEQLEGRTDYRSDLFALGCVLYELLVGCPAFDGATAEATVRRIQTTDPEFPPSIPVGVQRLVQRCLARRPEARWQSAADLADQLRFLATEPAIVPGTARSRRWMSAAVVAGVVVGVALGAALHRGETAAPSEVVAFTFDAPPGHTLQPFLGGGAPAMSPDGRRIAFIATSANGVDQLWVRDLDGVSPALVPGTEHAESPVWSPDGAEIAIVADRQLKRVSLAGRAVQAVGPVDGSGRLWDARGFVLETDDGRLLSVNMSGAARPLTLPSGARASDPAAVATDARLLVHLSGVEGYGDGLWLIDRDGGAPTYLTASDSGGAVAGGQLYFVRGRDLFRQPFDVRTARLQGTPSMVLSGLRATIGGNRRFFSVSAAGTIAALTGTVPVTRLAWFDRVGRREAIVTPYGTFANPALSPDGTRIAVNQIDEASGRRDLWLVDARRGVTSRLTHGPLGSAWGRWSPDGRRLAFHQLPGAGLVTFDTETAETRRVALPAGPPAFLASIRDWLPDDQSLLVLHLGDLWLVPLTAGQEPRPLVQSPGFDAEGRVSCDGQWIAYSSDASGRFEIYVAPMSDPKAARQVSNGGGLEPIWRRDSRELYYLSPERVLTAVDVSGPPLNVSPPHALFDMPTGVLWDANVHYDAAADGQRFVVAETGPSPTPLAITVLTDWRTAGVADRPVR